jgi:hypothetical protein
MTVRHYDFTVDQNSDEMIVGVCKTGYKGIVKRSLSDGKITIISLMGPVLHLLAISGDQDGGVRDRFAFMLLISTR